MPNHNRKLLELCAKKDISPEAMEAAGLAVRRDGGKLQVRFRERLLFPVADASGRTVGFGGRYLPGSWAEQNQRGKYENSPEGPLFPKRQILYGIERLHRGLRDCPEDPILVCEGYLDVILLHQAGLTTSVAALGTALTDEHSRRLQRFDRTVVLLMDPDEAGRRAAAKAGRLLVKEGVDVRVAELPDGQDPADMVAPGTTGGTPRTGRECLGYTQLASRYVVSKGGSVRPDRARPRRHGDGGVDLIHPKSRGGRGLDTAGAGSPGGLDGCHPQIGPWRGPPHPSPRAVLRFHPRPPSPTQLPSCGATNARSSPAILHDPSALSRFRSELEALELSDSAAQEVLTWSLTERAGRRPHDLESCMLAFPEGVIAQWLDSMRHIQWPSDLSRALESALSAHVHLREDVFPP